MRGEIENVKKILGFWEWVHVFLMLAVAAYLRFQGLGTLSFYGDEELSALAVQGILSDGYPHMPSGMAYWRGVPYSYLAAGCALLGGLTEFSIRIPSAFFGVLTIPIFYGLAKRLIGLIPASMAVWLLVLSSWHIDMSREARMYSMFLFSFLMCLFCFERGFIQVRKPFIALTIIAGILTLMLHQLGVFIILFIGLAGILLKRLVKYRVFLLGTVIGLGMFWFIYRDLTKFIIPGASVKEATTTLIFKLPYINYSPKLWTLNHILNYHSIIFGIVCLSAIFATFYICNISKRLGKLNITMALMLWLLVILAIFNMFGLICVIVIAFALTMTGDFKNWIRQRRKLIFWMCVLLSSIYIFWFLYGTFIWKGGDFVGLTELQLVKKVVKDSFSYPAMHIITYLEPFPIMTVIICISSAIWVISFRNGSEAKSFPMAVFIWFWIPLLALGLTREWISLRYSLPIYPFYLMIFAWTIYHAFSSGNEMIKKHVSFLYIDNKNIKKVTIGFFSIMLIFPFANEQHGIFDSIATSRLSYGQHIFPSFHGFPFHPDHKGAGNYVKAHLLDDDVIVAFDVQQQHYYVGRVNYWIREVQDAKNYSYLDGNTWRDIYTSSIVIKSLEELQLLLYKRGHNRVWLITSGELTGSLAYLIPNGIHELLTLWSQHRVFVGNDGVTSVYLLDNLSESAEYE